MNEKVLTVTLNPCIDKTSVIDTFSYGGLNRVISSRIDVGGKGINVSRALSNFGVPSVSSGISGEGRYDFMLNSLENEGVKCSFTLTKGEIRTNLKLYDQNSKITTEISEKGLNVSENVLSDFVESFEELLIDKEYLVLAGSTAPGISEEIYAELISFAKKKGVKVFLDADGNRLKNGLKEIPFAVKPNRFELEQYVGRKLENTDEIVSAMKELLNSGIELVIVSLGADGAVFMNKTGVYKTTPFEIDCKSTVGAGDTMVAATVFSCINGFDLKKTAMFATAAGTLTSALEGTQMCKLQDVENRYGDVQIEELVF